MQDGDTLSINVFAAPVSGGHAEVTEISTQSKISAEKEECPSEIPFTINKRSPEKSNGRANRRRITLGNFAIWPRTDSRYSSLRQSSAPVPGSTIPILENPSSQSSFNPRRSLWPRTNKTQDDIEQGFQGRITSDAPRAVESSRASHRSQASTSSATNEGSESEGSVRASRIDANEKTTTTRQAFSRFRERFRDDPNHPLRSDIPIIPARPPTASSSTFSAVCPYPPIPDPVDPAKRLGRSQLWIQRILVWLVVIVLNGACVIAYVESTRHLWVLVLILFVKAKDVLSTLIALSYLSSRKLWRTVTSEPEAVPPKQILSMITCYNETEEQIMKTVESIRENELNPHNQILCLILDGKSKELVKRKILRVVRTLKRPYITWQHTRNEVVVDCGFLDGTPIIYIEKVKNTGKKDSLILGHDLFNVMRDDAPQYTRLLREEIWSLMMPSLMQLPGGPRVDAIFCTDADSTIHKDALKRLAESLHRDKRAVAACGILLAELGYTEWTIWSLFQQFQYCYGQFVRRMAEGIWGRVTCLPGCITMIAVRPEMGPAISDYAKPVTDKAFFRHQVQYLGTDRRLTYSMLSQSGDLKTVFVPDAVSETVVPQSLSHYLSQRRRWGSNAYFNDWFYLLGPHQYLITRLWSLIDISRMTIVYCRQANNILFIYGLARNFNIVKIIPLLIVTQTPTVWFLTLVISTQPLLRRRVHKIIIGLIINDCISWCLSILVFSRIVLELGSTAWGRTGTSTASRDPMLRVRTPRNSVARRLSSLFRNSSAEEVGNRGLRRSSLLQRMSFTIFNNSSRNSMPPSPNKERDGEQRPDSATINPASWFTNAIWKTSRERLSRMVPQASTGSQSETNTVRMTRTSTAPESVYSMARSPERLSVFRLPRLSSTRGSSQSADRSPTRSAKMTRSSTLESLKSLNGSPTRSFRLPRPSTARGTAKSLARSPERFVASAGASPKKSSRESEPGSRRSSAEKSWRTA